MTTGPLSTADGLVRHFYEATAEGRLLIQHCATCDAFQFHPRGHCLGCGGEPSWVEASGSGVVHTFTVVHRTSPPFDGDVPFVVAVVELAEGPRLLTRLVAVEPDEVRCDLRVQVTFIEEDGLTLPYFTPSADRSIVSDTKRN